ncbi:pteridine reductase [uncultured Spongiibacter sp.]|uniref:pteridine reductase n=1 Tax=uncultured Spongiibacter sp. TaxID=870896 RepID=UPI002594DB4E|nr:pteridine reductase [uncultured Spongiibacter sp.]
MSQLPVALVTGGSQRIGAEISRQLHAQSYQVIVHCRRHNDAAQSLCDKLNARRANSAAVLYADLEERGAAEKLATAALNTWGRIDALINNASGFYPTPLGTVTDADWDSLMNSNVKGAFFLSQALYPALAEQRGAIVNLVDIYGERPLPQHPVYSMAKAALAMMTRSLAVEMAPDVRVNGIAPGAILPPVASDAFGEEEAKNVRERVPLQRWGGAAEIAATVRFLLREDSYVTGQIIAVDGGRSLML